MRLQHAYVASTMTQDASYFDLHGAGEIATRAGKDINTIRVAFGEKLGYMFWSGSTLVAAIVSAFVNAPRYAGVLITTIPFLVIVFSGLAILSERVGSPALRVEGLAGSLIEQILSSVRVVQSFGMEKTLLERLDKDVLNRLEKLGMNRAAVRAGEMSAIYGVLFSVYSECPSASSLPVLFTHI
jgi:ATP-binding cassette, subfamily B (MDR/TAP), member 1